MADVCYVRNGIATILNYVEFDSQRELTVRKGSDKDADAVYQTFLNLGFTFYSAHCNDPFKTKCYGLRNGTSGETKQLLTDLLTDDDQLKKCDCLVVIIASHGRIGSFATYDGFLSIEKELISPFDDCSLLKGKPKLFFIQACRPEKACFGGNSPSTNAQEPEDIVSKSDLPKGSDLFIAYPTIAGKYSYRHQNIGSWFLDEISKCFIPQNAATMDLHELMREVRRNVANQRTSSGTGVVKQCISTVDQLFRTVKFVVNPTQVTGGESLILKGVPFFDNYFARDDEESNIRKGLLNLANRDSEESKGFCFVVHGCGGIGKSTLVAQVLRKSQHYITQECNIQIVIWLNCYKWRDGFNNSDRKPDEFFRELLDLGTKIVKEKREWEREKMSLETRGLDFVSVTQMIDHFAKKGQRILFVLNDAFHYSIISSLRMQCNSSICCVLTREATVLEIPGSGSTTFLQCSDVENPLKVGYFTDERVLVLFTEGDLKRKLHDQQLGRLVRMSCGLPLIVNLILGHFKQNKYKSNYERAFKDLTENVKLGEFEVDSIVLGRDERQAKQLFEFSFQSLNPEHKEKYFIFLLFDPVDEVEFKWLKDLWLIQDDFDARNICDSFEQLSLVRHILVESKFSWEKKDCYVVHQILWEQALENAEQYYQLTTTVNTLLTQMIRICILTQRTSIDINDRLSKLLTNLNMSTSQFALEAILSHIKNEELGSWCSNEIRRIPQLSGKYEMQIISSAKANHAYLTRLLLENDANIEAKDICGNRPLIVASKNGHIEVVKLLLGKGADIEAKNIGGYTPLILASLKGHIDVVKLLIDKGADIEAKEIHGNRSLIFASRYGHIDVVKLLIRKGAEIHAKDDNGNMALNLASQNGHVEVVQLLTERGAGSMAKDDDDDTSLIFASRDGHVDVVKLLMERAYFYGNDEDGNTSLNKASQNGHIDVVKWLIELGADIHAKDVFGNTSLSLASQNGHINVVKWLIELGADINTKDRHGNTSLIFASRNGHIDVVKLLIGKGADIHGKNYYDWTPLLLASQNGHMDVVKWLIELGADINTKDRHGNTSLSLASQNGHIDVVKWLIELGADINTKDRHGNTSLIFASRNGHTEVVKLLIGKGSDIEAKNIGGNTPLFLASQNKHTDVVELLMEMGADIHAKNECGSTPLILAWRDGHIDLVKLLIGKGNDIQAKDEDGNAPLNLASQNGHIDVVKWLIGKGADIEAKNIGGYTPLILASLKGHIDVVKLLIDKGADIEAKEIHGNRSLIFASRYGHIDVVKLLVRKGAEIYAKNDNGNTALNLASQNGHFDVVKLLMESGAGIEAKGDDNDTSLICCFHLF